MELTHIKYFLEVARTEHVTKSAQTLCIVQPALTHALHKLEDELGVKLFQSSGRNIKLTEAGNYFYKKVKPLYEDIEALPARLRAKSDTQTVTVSLKVLAASSFVTNAVVQFKKQAPDLRFYLVQREESTLYDRVYSVRYLHTDFRQLSRTGKEEPRRRNLRVLREHLFGGTQYG